MNNFKKFSVCLMKAVLVINVTMISLLTNIIAKFNKPMMILSKNFIYTHSLTTI